MQLLALDSAKHITRKFGLHIPPSIWAARDLYDELDSSLHTAPRKNIPNRALTYLKTS